MHLLQRTSSIRANFTLQDVYKRQVFPHNLALNLYYTIYSDFNQGNIQQKTQKSLQRSTNCSERARDYFYILRFEFTAIKK